MKLTQKPNVAVVCGGYSGESEVSMKSAAMVMRHIDRDKYTPYKVVIERDRWYLEKENGELYPIDKNDFSCAQEDGWIQFDLAFIIIHGTPGEDGKLQGYFDMMQIPHTTGSVLNMSLTFNKSATTRFLRTMGYPVANSVILHKAGSLSADEILNQLSLPLFVKPNEGGSSLGISKVKLASELEEALVKAHEASPQVIVEEFIPGREFTCGVFRKDNRIQALHITEIDSEKEFFDYAAKYSYDQTREITPARLPADLYKECQEQSERIYRDLDCEGVVRIDYILNERTFYIIEVNTVPGMTEHSIVPQQAEAMEISKFELVNYIVESALDRAGIKGDLE